MSKVISHILLPFQDAIKKLTSFSEGLGGSKVSLNSTIYSFDCFTVVLFYNSYSMGGWVPKDHDTGLAVPQFVRKFERVAFSNF